MHIVDINIHLRWSECVEIILCVGGIIKTINGPMVWMKNKKQWAWIAECISAFMLQQTTAKKMFSFIFTATYKLPFDNIFT